MKKWLLPACALIALTGLTACSTPSASGSALSAAGGSPGGTTVTVRRLRSPPR